MSKHPVQEAFGFGEVMSETAGAEDIADAIETYAPFVAFSVADITTRNLERTRHVVLITGSAIRFYKYDATNAEDEDGETVIWDSEDRPFVLVQRGDRYDIPFSYTGPLGEGEKLNPIAIVTPLVLPSGLPGSLAFCLEPPDSEAVVLFERSADEGASWSEIFTLTFGAGQRKGALTMASDVALSVGDMLRPVAPSPIDATMEGLVVTIVATR